MSQMPAIFATKNTAHFAEKGVEHQNIGQLSQVSNELKASFRQKYHINN